MKKLQGGPPLASPAAAMPYCTVGRYSPHFPVYSPYPQPSSLLMFPPVGRIHHHQHCHCWPPRTQPALQLHSLATSTCTPIANPNSGNEN